MTREFFLENINDMWELQEFCDSNNLYTMEDIRDSESWNEYIDESLVDWARENTWNDLLSILRDVEENAGYDYYEWDEDYGRYTPVDFDDMKDRVLSDADYEECWDNEDENEDDNEYDAESDSLDEECAEDDCTIEDMLAESLCYVQSFTEQELAAIGEGLRDVRAMIE